MKRKIAFLTVLLAASAALVFVAAPKAKACAGGAGDQHYVETVCVLIDENGNETVLGASNDCESGTSNCNDNDCSRFE